MEKNEHEALVKELEFPEAREAYKSSYDNYRVGIVPRLLGSLLVGIGNGVYGRKPSYGKFKAIEVIARLPYHSWEVASYMFLTLFYANEERAIELCQTSAFSRVSQDNETMHVIVISKLAQKYGQNRLIRHTLLPLFFSFSYATASFLLYLFSPRSAFQLNYLFEDHAYRQYALFLELYGAELSDRPILSDFLHFYGRQVRSEYEFFASVRNDELIHRNQSAHLADALKH